MAEQPAVHELVTVVRAPSVVLSGADGQLRGSGAQGWFRHDRRLLSRLELDLLGVSVTPLKHHLLGESAARFDAVVIGAQPGLADPTVHVRRRREVAADSLTEQVVITNSGLSVVSLRVEFRLATDLASMEVVKEGGAGDLVSPDLDTVSWSGPDAQVSVTVDEPAQVRGENSAAVLSWTVRLHPSDSWAVTLVVTDSATGGGFAPQPPTALPRWDVRPVPDRRGGRVLERSLADLRAMLMGDPQDPSDYFTAAGSPWFLTLFGRDSLITARSLLPLGTDLAGATLRTLARRQGSRTDPRTEEQPGKILHEVRRGALRANGLDLPPVYYGTIDATPLWVCLLHDAWCAGLPADQIRALLPNLHAAMRWITGPADADGDRLLEYGGSDNGGLTNQGWKDSGDSIRSADGGFGRRPLALCEVQGYAHAAALGAAALVKEFDQSGAEQWLIWAERLRSRFRDTFWISDESGPYPAIAVDGDKRPVTGASSNMAHLLGTGILDTTETRQVAARLALPDLDSGYGLRTLATTSAAFNPFSYHCGSIWPHDTAIAIRGLAAEGFTDLADGLACGLLDAAEAFDDRLPELYAVTVDQNPVVVAYPAACRPQAWASAAAVTAVGQLSRWA